MSEEMKKNDLPKPKRHSVISNIIYSFKPTAENRPLHMLWYFVGIVVKVLVPVLASYASALVVSMASGGHTIVTVIFSIGAVFAVYGLVTGLSAFFEQMNQMHFVEGRLGSFFRIWTGNGCPCPSPRWRTSPYGRGPLLPGKPSATIRTALKISCEKHTPSQPMP